MQPFPNVESDQVECETDGKTRQRSTDEVSAIGRKVLPSISAHKQCIPGGEVQQTWIIGKVRRPIHPARHEACKFPERFLAPYVHPAFFGIPRRQLEHTKRQGNKIRETSGYPDDDGARSGRSSRCDPTQT